MTFYLHVGKLLHGRKTREVEPGHVLPVLVVISLVLQVPEGGTTQSVKLQGVLLVVRTRHNVYIYEKGAQTNICMIMRVSEPGNLTENRENMFISF